MVLGSTSLRPVSKPIGFSDLTINAKKDSKLKLLIKDQNNKNVFEQEVDAMFSAVGDTLTFYKQIKKGGDWKWEGPICLEQKRPKETLQFNHSYDVSRSITNYTESDNKNIYCKLEFSDIRYKSNLNGSIIDFHKPTILIDTIPLETNLKIPKRGDESTIVSDGEFGQNGGTSQIIMQGKPTWTARVDSSKNKVAYRYVRKLFCYKEYYTQTTCGEFEKIKSEPFYHLDFADFVHLEQCP